MINTPRQVLLFSGHMIDAPDRQVPRFAPEKEGSAARMIAQTLDRLDAGPADLALAQGSSGGDILFLEACKQRGVRLQLLLPLPEAQFIEQSILPSADGENWQQRYEALRAGLGEPPRVMPTDLDPLVHLDAATRLNLSADVFARCNLWLLDTALSWGIEKLRFICLWDGNGGDGPGGTAHMVDVVKRCNGQVIWLDVNRL